MKKIRNISIIIIIVVLIGVIGCICYNKYFKKQDTNDKFDSETIEIIKSAIGVDDVEFELDVLEYEQLEDDTEKKNMTYHFKANIAFNKEQEELLLKEFRKKRWLVFPGNAKTAFSDVVKEIYSEKTGQPADSIVKDNIYVLYSYNEDSNNIDENAIGREGEIYYWQCDDDTYELYFEYREYGSEDEEAEDAINNDLLAQEQMMYIDEYMNLQNTGVDMTIHNKEKETGEYSMMEPLSIHYEDEPISFKVEATILKDSFVSGTEYKGNIPMYFGVFADNCPVSIMYNGKEEQMLMLDFKAGEKKTIEFSVDLSETSNEKVELKTVLISLLEDDSVEESVKKSLGCVKGTFVSKTQNNSEPSKVDTDGYSLITDKEMVEKFGDDNVANNIIDATILKDSQGEYYYVIDTRLVRARDMVTYMMVNGKYKECFNGTMISQYTYTELYNNYICESEEFYDYLEDESKPHILIKKLDVSGLKKTDEMMALTMLDNGMLISNIVRSNVCIIE